MFKSSNFIERSLVGILSFFKESIFADEYASRKGFLQSLDPRIKVVIFFLLIVQILFVRNIFILLCFYALCLALTFFSRIDLKFFLKRTWVFIPLFSLFIAVPAIFSVVTPGIAVATFKIIGIEFVITHQGLFGAIFFVMRVVASVSLVILLSLTTRHFELLKVLRIFRVPQIFVMTAGMCYRYVYLFMELVENTYLAIKSRVGTEIHYKKGQHIVAWNIAYLWARSYQLNEEVYKAMLARGYRGEPAILDDFKVRTRDWLWLVSAVLMFIVVGLL